MTKKTLEDTGPIVHAIYDPAHHHFDVQVAYEHVLDLPIAHLEFLGHDLGALGDKGLSAFGKDVIAPAFASVYKNVDLYGPNGIKARILAPTAAVERDAEGKPVAVLRNNFHAQTYYEAELSIHNDKALSLLRQPPTSRHKVVELDQPRAAV
jgi:hypothetical protein